MKIYRTTVFLDGEQLGRPTWTTDSPADMNYLEVVCRSIPTEARITKTIETFKLINTERIAKP